MAKIKPSQIKGIKQFIDPYWVEKGANIDNTAFEVGDKFEGWESSTRYLVGIVIALPFDVDDSAKVSLIIDNML